MLVTGNTVVLEVTWQGTQTGPLQGPTGTVPDRGRLSFWEPPIPGWGRALQMLCVIRFRDAHRYMRHAHHRC